MRLVLDRDFSQWEAALRARYPVTHERDHSIRSTCSNCGSGPRCLRVTQGRSQVLARCFNGCSFFNIRDALFNLAASPHPAILRAEKKTPPKYSKIIAKYFYDLYDDPFGPVTLTQARYECEEVKPNGKHRKGFYYVHPDGRASHRLDEHVAHDLPLFHTEMVGQHPGADKILVAGAKKACLVQRNAPEGQFVVLATTQGENVFPSDHPLEILLGPGMVWLIPDNNWVGVTHVEKIGAWLTARGQEHHIVEPYSFGYDNDVGDFFEAGGTFSKLRDLMALSLQSQPPFDTHNGIIPGNAPIIDEPDDVIRARLVTASVHDGGFATPALIRGAAMLTPIGAETIAIPGRPIIIFPPKQKNNNLSLPPGTLVRMSQYGRPDPRQWIMPPFLPWGAASTIYADAGMFKTFLVIALCLSISLGLPFCGVAAEIFGSVIFIDAELDSDEFALRAHRILDGMGLGDFNLPDTLTYMNTRGSLLKDLDLKIRAAIKQEDPVLVAIDSWQFATGIEPKDVAGTIDYYNRFKTYGDGSVLVVDHTRAPVGGDVSSRPYGNNYKFAATRSALFMSRPNPGALVLSQKKSTFSAETDLFIEMKLDGNAGPVTFTKGDPNDIKFQPPQDEEGDADEKVLTALEETHPADALTLAKKVGFSESYVRAILARQKKGQRHYDHLRLAADYATSRPCTRG